MALGCTRTWPHVQGAARGTRQIQSLSRGMPGTAGEPGWVCAALPHSPGSLRAGRAQSLPQPQAPKLLFPCSSHTPPASKCLLTLLGNLFSPRLTCTVSSAYGSDKLIKCAERTKRSLFPPSAPCRRLIQTSAAASKASKISFAINAASERGVCTAKVNTKFAGIFVVLRAT